MKKTSSLNQVLQKTRTINYLHFEMHIVRGEENKGGVKDYFLKLKQL